MYSAINHILCKNIDVAKDCPHHNNNYKYVYDYFLNCNYRLNLVMELLFEALRLQLLTIQRHNSSSSTVQLSLPTSGGLVDVSTLFFIPSHYFFCVYRHYFPYLILNNKQPWYLYAILEIILSWRLPNTCFIFNWQGMIEGKFSSFLSTY